MKIADVLHRVLNRLQIGIEHNGRVDLFLFQKLDFGTQLRHAGQLRKDDEPEQSQ